jgi:hypothetical protein
MSASHHRRHPVGEDARSLCLHSGSPHMNIRRRRQLSHCGIQWPTECTCVRNRASWRGKTDGAESCGKMSPEPGHGAESKGFMQAFGLRPHP